MAYKIKKDPIGKIPKGQLIFWLIVRLAMIICATYSFVKGDLVMGFESVFCFIFTHLWDMFQLFGGKSFITKVPYSIMTYLNCFIAFGVVVGTTVNKFTSFDYIDVPEHFFAGFIAAAGGYELAVVIQSKQPKDKKISPALASLFALCFAVTITIAWEYYEFTMDRLYGLNLQNSAYNSESGLIDTMVDLILGSAGALTGMFVTAFTKNKVKCKKK